MTSLAFVRPLIKLGFKLEHHLVGFALGVLQFLVGLANPVHLRALAQLADHEGHVVGGELQQLGLAQESGLRQAAGIDRQTLDDLLDHLGDPVERKGQGLDVLALQRRHKRPAEFLGDLLGDAFVLPTGVDEIIDVYGPVVGGALPQKAPEQGGAGPGLLGAGLEQVEELLLFAKKLANREHEFGSGYSQTRRRGNKI